MALNKTKKTGIILGIVAILMFGFGYALVPLYNVMCQALGINGKTGGPTAQAQKGVIDYSREITVQFVATNNANLPWKFYPIVKSIKVHPGENAKVAFYAENETNKTMTVQAIPSVTPGLAAQHLKKTECFCFTRQTLKANEGLEMPLLFHIDNELPKEFHTVTLSYTLFDVTNLKTKVPENKQGKIRS